MLTRMGALLSWLWGGGGGGGAEASAHLDVPDAATGLTPRQKEFVRSTWKVVKQDMKSVGVELFIRFFEARPDAQKAFRNFENVPLSELRGSKRLLAHTNTVMYALDSAVDNLDDPECLHEMLVKMGENHGRRKVAEKDFWDLKEVFMTLLKEKLDIHLNEEGEQAWSKTVDVVYKGIFAGLSNPVQPFS